MSLSSFRRRAFLAGGDISASAIITCDQDVHAGGEIRGVLVSDELGNMREMLVQYGTLNAEVRALLDNPASAILEIDRKVSARQRSMAGAETEHVGVPLGGSLIPWIDKDMGNGVSREEWKAGAETNKILGRAGGALILVEGICVRVSAMRCHSQALTIKLKRDLPLDEIERIIAGGNDWVKLVPNTREASIRQLTPVAVTGTCPVR